MEATVTITSKLTRSLLAEFSISTWSLNRNSPRLLMDSLALKTPFMVLLIRKIGTGGTVSWSRPINWDPLSVPESYGSNVMTCQASRHRPFSQKSWLSTPTNQSGDGASMLIRDTLEWMTVTLTWITGFFIYCTKPIPRQNELPDLSSRLLSLYFGFECSSLTLKQVKKVKDKWITDIYWLTYAHQTKKRLSQVSHHGPISMFTTCEYKQPIKKNAQNNTKQKQENTRSI